MNDYAGAYIETHRRVADLVLTSGPESWTQTVPVCPDWSVHDLVSHLTGLAEDWEARNLDGYGSGDWTAHQVATRDSVATPLVLEEWDRNVAAITPLLRDPESAGVPAFMPLVTLTDLAHHEQDLRHTLGAPGARDSAAVQLGMQSQIGGLRQQFASRNLPPLRIAAAGHREWMVGRGEPVVSVEAGLFDLFRAAGGRRTLDEARGFAWEGAYEELLPNLVQWPFSWRSEPLGE